MALKEQDVVFTTTDADGNLVIQMPITRVENVEGAIKTVNDATPDANGNLAVDVGVKTVNGSAPDAAGNVAVSIPESPTDYVTNVSVNGATVTATKKDGSQSTSTVDLSGRVAVAGARGSLAGYETSGTSTTINASSPDSNEVGSAITVENGTEGTSWTKVVRVTAEVTVTLGDAWVWAGGSAPTIASGGVLVCCWCGSGGIAQFVSPS